MTAMTRASDIEAACRHLDEAIHVLTLNAYRSADGQHWRPDNEQCNIAVELQRVDCAIGPKGESIFARIAEIALAAFTEIKLAKAALEDR